MCMSLFAFVMQEVNAQIINHQQKHFYEEQLEIFASSKYITGMGLFSQCTDFFGFCAKCFSAWAQSSYTFYFFPLVLLDEFFIFFFCSSTTGKASPTLATAVLGGMAGVSKTILNWCSPGRV